MNSPNALEGSAASRFPSLGPGAGHVAKKHTDVGGGGGGGAKWLAGQRGRGGGHGAGALAGRRGWGQ